MNALRANFYLVLLSAYRWLLMRTRFTMRFIFLPGLEKTRWKIGKLRTWQEFNRARKQVPAYDKFLKSHGFGSVRFGGSEPLIEEIPSIDKENYVKVYPIGERCRGGVIPPKGIIIDESSGSSGKPTNWARGLNERTINKHFLQFGLSNLLGEGPYFMINAFALGPWATGMNISMAFVEYGILKSLGPDVPKIINTLKDFGSSYRYVIFGYPPFLKILADSDEINWKELNVTFICGGEAMSESMRDYALSRGIKRFYSSFGASDLELNIGAENNTTIALRKLLSKNKALSDKLVRHAGMTPMIFQFPPFDFFIETNEKGELLISICRKSYLSPKIRYNIHDLGHVVRTPDVKEAMKLCGIDPSVLPDWKTDLPFLFHYGRADNAVSYYGSNIAPGDLQEAIFGVPELAGIFNSFSIVQYENEQCDKRLKFCIESNGKSEITSNLALVVQPKLLEKLAEINQDFREAYRMMPPEAYPSIEILPTGTGLFAENDIRIKAKYIR